MPVLDMSHEPSFIAFLIHQYEVLMQSDSSILDTQSIAVLLTSPNSIRRVLRDITHGRRVTEAHFRAAEILVYSTRAYAQGSLLLETGVLPEPIVQAILLLQSQTRIISPMKEGLNVIRAKFVLFASWAQAQGRFQARVKTRPDLESIAVAQPKSLDELRTEIQTFIPQQYIPRGFDAIRRFINSFIQNRTNTDDLRELFTTAQIYLPEGTLDTLGNIDEEMIITIWDIIYSLEKNSIRSSEQYKATLDDVLRICVKYFFLPQNKYSHIMITKRAIQHDHQIGGSAQKWYKNEKHTAYPIYIATIQYQGKSLLCLHFMQKRSGTGIHHAEDEYHEISTKHLPQ